jgi:hypothetical protein
LNSRLYENAYKLRKVKEIARMNVGILTMHRVRNWGSFLQAFALKKNVEELGHEVSFLDIKPSNDMVIKSGISDHEKNRRLTNIFNKISLMLILCLKGQLITRIKDRYNAYQGMLYQQKMYAKYDNEFLPMLGVDKYRYEYDKAFDLVIIGSDEVFNCLQPHVLWRKSLQLFGDKINAKKIITYAASFGYTKMEDLKKNGLKKDISNALRKNITTISVRDINSSKIVEQLINEKPELNLDPALVYDFSKYMHNNNKFNRTNYLIVYAYPERINDPATIKVIKEFALSNNKTIISLFCYYNWCDQSIIPDTPFELLDYFVNADYVVTDTFHGTIFSIKYNKIFCTIIRDSNTQKIEYLLNQFKLRDRRVRTHKDIKAVLEQPIDYEAVNEILTAEQHKTKTYLSNAISLE